MVTIKNLISISTAAIILGGAVVVPSAYAWSNPFERARKSIETEIGRGTGYIHDAGRRTVSYKVKIRNDTGGSIHYRLNRVPQLLSNHKIRTHRGSDVSGPEISFDNGNNQTITYALGRNGSYAFGWNGGVLDLYND